MMNIEVENKLIEIKNIVKDRLRNQTCYFRGEPKFYENISASLHRHREIIFPFYHGEGASMKSKIPSGIALDYPQRIPVLPSFPSPKVMNIELKINIQNPKRLYDLTMIAGSFITERTGGSLNKETTLGILQHLGYPTPYIDFTKDYLVSLFFACNGLPDEDGRIIILGSSSGYKFHDMTRSEFPIAKERAIAQKSVMLEKLELKKTEDNYEECRIPCDLKPKILAYLEEQRVNSTSLFPDSWEEERKYRPYNKFYQGVRAEREGDASTAISLYTDAVALDSDFVDAYKRRGRVFYYKCWFEKAQLDLEKAKSLDAADKIIGLHPYFDEVNVGCVNRLLGEIYRRKGDKDKSYTCLKRAKDLQDRYNEREEK